MKPRLDIAPHLVMEVARGAQWLEPHPLVDSQGRHSLVDGPKVEPRPGEPRFPWRGTVVLVVVMAAAMIGYAYL